MRKLGIDVHYREVVVVIERVIDRCYTLVNPINGSVL